MIQNVRMDSNNMMFFYKGIRLEQRVDVIETLEKLYQELKKQNKLPKTIIEIGMNNGGFSLVLNDSNISEQADIYCYDIVNRNFDQNLKGSRINWFIKDIFSIENEVKNLIQREGTTLLFCDGGNKVREFNTFAKYLKSGDLIFTHDYYKDIQEYEKYKDTRWGWLESRESDLADTAEMCNLVPFMQDDFEKCVWSSKIKL